MLSKFNTFLKSLLLDSKNLENNIDYLYKRNSGSYKQRSVWRMVSDRRSTRVLDAGRIRNVRSGLHQGKELGKHHNEEPYGLLYRNRYVVHMRSFPHDR